MQNNFLSAINGWEYLRMPKVSKNCKKLLLIAKYGKKTKQKRQNIAYAGKITKI